MLDWLFSSTKAPAFGVLEAQKVLMSTPYFRGPATGELTLAVMSAADLIARNMGADWKAWPKSRQVIAAAQRVLNTQGYEAGAVDGYAGHNTLEAYKQWDAARKGKPLAVIPEPQESRVPANKWPLQKDMTSFFGPPGNSNPKNTAGKVVLPIPFRIDWNLSQTTRSFNCHIMAAPAFQTVFDEAVRHYGEAQYRKLGLDRFAGCYNPRKMRGGTSWSTHAWGAAVDLYAEKNALHMTSKQALFAKPEYVPFWNIVEKQGLLSLGRAENRDWMHFQAAR